MLRILKIKEENYRNIFVISDIHAHATLFRKLLLQLDYNKQDLFLILGDSCDRGKELEETYQILFDLQKEVNIIHLMGNHEKMLEEYYTFGKDNPYFLTENGGRLTTKILDNNEDLLENILAYISEMPHIVESEHFLFVHAGLDFSVPLEQQKEDYILWTKDFFWNKRDNVEKTVIFGHTIQKDGMIQFYKHKNCIGVDCGSYRFHRIGCYEIKNKKIYLSEE